jgi:hypothetical protein
MIAVEKWLVSVEIWYVWRISVMTDQVQHVSELLTPEKSNRLSPTWFAENIMNPAINAGPLGVYNTAADLAHLPTVHLKTDEAKPYSPEWFAQGLSSGVGAAVPFALMTAATGSAMGALDRKLAGTALGATLNPYLTSEKIASIAGASIYGALQRPDADHTRLGNAIGMGAGLAVFSVGNSMVKDMPMLQKAMAYPLIGFVGGGTMAEVSQLASNLKFAKNDVALQGAIQGATMNTVMGLGSDYISKRLARDEKAVATRIAENQKESTRLVIESKANPADLKIEQSTPDSKAAFAKLAEMEREYTQYANTHKVQYPTGDQLDNLTASELSKVGVSDNPADYEIVQGFKGGRKQHPLPNAKVVAEEVGKTLKDMPLATDKGEVKIGEWNVEFGTADKARYFKDTYNQVVPRHHLLFVEETDEGFLKQVAQDNNYNYVVSRANSRGQAVGFLVNKRLEVKGTESIESVANVQGIPELRPALKVDLHDTASGQDFSAVVIHLKSMRGGPDATASVRAEQAANLARDLGPNFKGVIAGDWNTFLDKTSDLDPLKAAGFKINNAGDHSSTQAMGGRLDGFVIKNLSLGQETINPFFKNPLITRGLSDHALLSTILKGN